MLSPARGAHRMRSLHGEVVVAPHPTEQPNATSETPEHTLSLAQEGLMEGHLHQLLEKVFDGNVWLQIFEGA